MDFKEFIRDYDILLNMPVTEELVCFQIAKILLDERIVVKKEGSNSKYCYKITDMLKRENLLSLDGFKLVGTLRSYTKFLNSFINELLKDDKYSFIDSSGNVPLVPRNVVNIGQFSVSLDVYYGDSFEDFCIVMNINCCNGLKLSDLPVVR